MWLLDANVDAHLASVLRGFGIACDTACESWLESPRKREAGRRSGGSGFDCILTRDQAFAESAQRVLRSHPEFAIVVLRLAQKPWPQYRQVLLAAWSVSPIQPVAGQLVEWP